MQESEEEKDENLEEFISENQDNDLDDLDK
jgi:hypothetical protein